MKLELTEERKQIIDQTREEYLAHGLSTEPADFDAAEAAITELYASIDKSKPHFVRLSSPFAAELYINLLTQTWPEQYGGDQLWDQIRDQLRGQLGGQLWDQLGDQLWDQLGDQLRDQLWDQIRGQLWGQLGDQLRDQLWDQIRDQLRGQLRGQLRDQLWDQIRGQLWDQLGDQLRDQLRGQLRGQLGDQLWDQIRGQLRGQLRDQLWDQLWGQKNLRFTGTWFYGAWDYIWAWGEGGRRVGMTLPKKLSEQLDAHLTVCRSIGWWYPFNDFVIMTDRPEVLKRDDDQRVHCENGPAIKYRDGYSMYAWRGTVSPAEWFEGSPPSASDALRWENLEQRRVACEMIGWHHILKELGAQTIDKDADPLIGELMEVSIPDIGREKFLRVLCGTGREFALPVPPDMRSALQAQAWINNVPEDIIKNLEVRT